MESAEKDNRRGFFLAAIYGLWGIIAAAFTIPAAAYLLLPPRARREDEWTDAGDVSKLAIDSPVQVVFRRNRKDGWKVISEKNTAWVVRKSADKYVAFGPQCPHLGYAYHWDESKDNFLCPCHTSTFALDGTVVSGPSPRGLDRIAIKVENKRLLVGDAVTPGPEAKS